MSQYPNEKSPQSGWVYPSEQVSSTYTSGDGLAPSQYPPPPDYGYVVNHPDPRSANDYKAPPETVLAPPVDGLYYPDAGSSSSSAPQESKQMSLGAFFGNKGNPPMWNRPPPPQFPYNAFEPMRLVSNSHELSKGFPELPPACPLNPHPFATHDVTEEDWKRFLTDLKKAGSLSAGQRIKSNVIPMVTGMSFFTGFLATMAIEKRMKYKNRGAAGDLVDHWNHYFFGPRRMEVALCQASQRLSGKVGDSPLPGVSPDLHRRDDSSSSDDDKKYGHGQRYDRRAEKHARRAERRASRRAERAERREWRSSGENKYPYELIVSSI